jgi:TatD DNase family protein
MCVIPAVAVFNFATVRALAHAQGDAYALGIHPLCTRDAKDEDLDALDAELTARRDDPRLVAVGEIGLDYFVRRPRRPEAGTLFSHSVATGTQARVTRAHSCAAFGGQGAQASAPDRGRPAVAGHCPCLQRQRAAGAGVHRAGAEAGLRRRGDLRARAAAAPPGQHACRWTSIVMETDAPDIQPHWLYRTQAQRDAGEAQGRNEPGELPRIAQVVAGLRGIGIDELARPPPEMRSIRCHGWKVSCPCRNARRTSA